MKSSGLSMTIALGSVKTPNRHSCFLVTLFMFFPKIVLYIDLSLIEEKKESAFDRLTILLHRPYEQGVDNRLLVKHGSSG